MFKTIPGTRNVAGIHHGGVHLPINAAGNGERARFSQPRHSTNLRNRLSHRPSSRGARSLDIQRSEAEDRPEEMDENFKYDPVVISESNPDVLKATIDILSTPHSVTNANAATAVALLDSVQNNCAADFSTFCSDSNVASGYGHTRNPGLLSSLRQLFASAVKSSPHMPIFGWDNDNDDNNDDNDDGNQADDYNDETYSYSYFDDADTYYYSSYYADRRLEASVPGKEGPNPHEDQGEFFRMIHGYDLSQDPTYEGSLGFPEIRASDGATALMYARNEVQTSGDMCMMTHYNALSPSCQASITALQNFRSEYWSEEKEIVHPHSLAPLFGIVGLIYICFVVYRKRFSAKARNTLAVIKENFAVMEFINDNPGLKSTVERVYGHSLPARPSTVIDEDKGSFVCKFLRVIGRILFIGLMLNIVGISSVLLTMWMLQGVVHQDPETGETHAPRGLFILVLVLTIIGEFLVLWAVRRATTHLYHFVRSTVCPSSPSSPRGPILASTGMFSSFQDGYSPLSHSEMDYQPPNVGYAEMTAYPSSAPPVPLPHTRLPFAPAYNVHGVRSPPPPFAPRTI